MADNVNHPKHYTSHPSGIECIEVSRYLSFSLGSAYKYLFRRENKNDLLENLRKADWYLREELTHLVRPSAGDASLKAAAVISAHEPWPYSEIMYLIASAPQTMDWSTSLGRAQSLLSAEIQRLEKEATDGNATC